MFGEDFLGLRELGITSEVGVSSLSVPKKLLRPKGARVGAGSSLPYVEPLPVPNFLAHSFMIPLHTMQKQANGTSATLPATTSVCPTRVNEDGRRGHRSLATFLQVSFRCSCAVTSYQPKTPTPQCGWRHSGRDTVHLKAVVTAVFLLSNTAATGYTAAYTVSITSTTHPSGRCAKPGSNEDGTARADCWWEIDERYHKEETEEREGSLIIYNWRRHPRCCEWVGWRWDEWSYQYERRERHKRSADDCGRISTGKCRRDHRGDADVDNDSGRNARTGRYYRRCPCCDEEERWAREGEEGEDGSGFEGRHRHGVVIVLRFC